MELGVQVGSVQGVIGQLHECPGSAMEDIQGEDDSALEMIPLKEVAKVQPIPKQQHTIRHHVGPQAGVAHADAQAAQWLVALQAREAALAAHMWMSSLPM